MALYDFPHLHNVQYSYRNTITNSVDPDQTAPKEQFDLGLHYLPFIGCLKI